MAAVRDILEDRAEGREVGCYDDEAGFDATAC